MPNTPMRATRRMLQRLVTLGPRDWAELVQAQGALIWAQVLVWMRPTGRLVSSDQAPASTEAPAMDPRAPRLALAVGRAAENGLFRPLCLVQAVALHQMLEHRGI